MHKKPDISDADAKFNTQVAELKAQGWDVHHDSNGWYVVAPNEEEPESGQSLGSNGRAHYRENKDAWQAIILPDTDPKPRDFIRMFAWLVSIGAVLAGPFTIPPILDNIRKSRGK